MPVLVVVLPPIVLLGAGLITSTRLAIFSGLGLTAASALFSQLGRDRGKQLEPELWQSWGGEPTLRLLRYRDASDIQATARLHQRIEEVLDEPLPSSDDEEDDAARADARYEAATRRLITLTRDHGRFPLVFKENINYGMRRNLLGLRAIGIVVCLITALAAALLLALASGHLSQRAGRYAPGLGVTLLGLAFWIFIVAPAWVKIPAEAYAEQLMESIELLVRDARASDAN